MSEGWKEILYAVRDRVATITLNRPDRLNAWTAVMSNELREAFEKADAATDVRVIVLTGADRGFCAAADMAPVLGRRRQVHAQERGRLADRGPRRQLRPALQLYPRAHEAGDRRPQWPGCRHRPRHHTSPRSTSIIKRQVYEALLQSLAEATAIANREQEVCRDTEDLREGVAHYVGKRSPNFTGR